MTITTILLAFLSLLQTAPKDSVSLSECYRLAKKNYPLSKNLALQDKVTALNADVAGTGYYPQINVSGQATYQSEVTSFSLPGPGGPPPVSKDQYEAALDVTQVIFNGGRVGAKQDLERAKGRRKKNQTRVDMHKVRSQVDQVYYGILLSQQQAKTIDLLLKNLRKQLSSIRSKVKNGALLPSQQHILQAEVIKAKQDSAQTQSNIVAGYNVLSELTGKEFNSGIDLQLPKVQPDYQSMQPARPEYDLFESMLQTISQQKKLANTGKWPRLAVFGKAAYGRQGLNFLNNEFHDYYIAGVKVQWDFWNFFNAGRKSEALTIRQQQVNQKKKAFNKQLNASLDRTRQQISAVRSKMERDKKIIDLREKIVQESSSQLKNGVITATEYVTQLTEANQAKLSKYIHRVQLAQAQTNYLTTLGISGAN